MNTDDGVLTALKVIDCATYVAGPAAGSSNSRANLLADEEAIDFEPK